MSSLMRAAAHCEQCFVTVLGHHVYSTHSRTQAPSGGKLARMTWPSARIFHMRLWHCSSRGAGSKLASSESMKAMCRCCSPNLTRHCLNASPRGFWTPAEQTTQQLWLHNVRRVTDNREPVACDEVCARWQQHGATLRVDALTLDSVLGGS